MGMLKVVRMRKVKKKNWERKKRKGAKTSPIPNVFAD